MQFCFPESLLRFSREAEAVFQDRSCIVESVSQQVGLGQQSFANRPKGSRTGVTLRLEVLSNLR
jgi:hypothetical protein